MWSQVSLWLFGPPSVNNLREAIWRQVVFNDGTQVLDISLAEFHTLAFVDCLEHYTCAPSSCPINVPDGRRDNAYDLQRAFFTQYGKKYGVKLQGLLLPNGKIGHVWCHSVAQNDRGMINISGLEEYLRDILQPYRVGEATLPAVYGDGIYVPSEVVINRGDNNGLYFCRMNAVCEKIEHKFGLFTSIWKHLEQTYKLKILEKNGYILKRVIVYWFMTNVYTYQNESKVTIRFGI